MDEQGVYCSASSSGFTSRPWAVTGEMLWVTLLTLHRDAEGGQLRERVLGRLENPVWQGRGKARTPNFQRGLSPWPSSPQPQREKSHTRESKFCKRSPPASLPTGEGQAADAAMSNCSCGTAVTAGSPTEPWVLLTRGQPCCLLRDICIHCNVRARCWKVSMDLAGMGLRVEAELIRCRLCSAVLS